MSIAHFEPVHSMGFLWILIFACGFWFAPIFRSRWMIEFKVECPWFMHKFYVLFFFLPPKPTHKFNNFIESENAHGNQITRNTGISCLSTVKFSEQQMFFYPLKKSRRLSICYKKLVTRSQFDSLFWEDTTLSRWIELQSQQNLCRVLRPLIFVWISSSSFVILSRDFKLANSFKIQYFIGIKKSRLQTFICAKNRGKWCINLRLESLWMSPVL